MSIRTTFSGLSIALRALQTQQISLDITGHNVANVNNPNYSRQTALHSATRPYPTPMMGFTPSSGQLGTGVQISQINRMRDSFVDLRLRQQLHSSNYWSTMKDGLQQVELFFNEPSENGISYALDQFWDSLQDLSREPEFASVREVVVQRAEVLVEAITGTRTHLQSLRENINGNIPLKVSEVNSLATRIADLNVQIGKISATGSLPNDLFDARDALIEKLSHLVDVEVVQDYAGMVGVTIGGASLVHRGTAYGLAIQGETVSGENYKRNKVIWSSTGNEVTIRSGEIAAFQDLRDKEIQNVINDLDVWTREFAENVNDIHQQGYDLSGAGNDGKGFTFFEFKKLEYDNDGKLKFAALNIKVSSHISSDDGGNVNNIRASKIANAVGNGENAIALAKLRSELVKYQVNYSGGKSEIMDITLGDAFNSIISKLGVDSQKAVRMSENEADLELHLKNLKDSISGVSLDEEMTNMIRFQHAYSAAARVMTAMDEALDTIINRLGIVGR